MQFPYGIADFQKIREEDYLYVDRTDRIPLLERAGDQLLFLRPRRFGKSLWLSVLENYYDVAKADRFDALFGDLSIGQGPTPRRGSYYVMRWDFSVVDAQGDSEHIRKGLYEHVNGRIRGFLLRYREHFDGIADVASILVGDDALANFGNLLDAIAQTPHKLYLFIDEYDNFANEVLASRMRGVDRYWELVAGDGILKTLFKVVKSVASGQGLDRVFITGVSPVVMSDITSGYNIVEDITSESDYHDLCGFTSDELQGILGRVAEVCDLTPIKTDEARHMMRAFYNGYRFSEGSESLVYNPTLALYFLKALAMDCEFPKQILDTNLAMDRNRIRFVAGLPHGEEIITRALAANDTNPEQAIVIDKLGDRFGVEEMLEDPRDSAFLASLLYYFGVLTLDGRSDWGELRLTIPNLVVRALYAERLDENLLPAYEDRERRRAVAMRFFAEGELEPLCDFMEQRFLKVFDNRDLRWSNELTVKTAFLTILFNDTFYIVDSETAIDRGYADLTLILRPDTRKYKLLDHLLEFKFLRWEDLGADNQAARGMDRAALRALAPVADRIREAEAQLADYRKTLERVYGDKLKLRTHAVVCVGMERLVW